MNKAFDLSLLFFLMFHIGMLHGAVNIEETTRHIQTLIKESHQQLEHELQELPPPEEIQVILEARHKTVLSNQISTPILSSQVSAPVQVIYKRLGQKFEKNEILIKIDDTIFIANLAKAKAAVERAQVVLQARKDLFAEDIASLVDLKEAEALLAAAQAEYVLAQTQLAGATILGPYKGKVLSVLIEEFELPQPGQALIEVIDDQVLLAKILAPSTYLKDIYIGKILPIHIKEIGKTVDAKIIRIGAAIEPASSTIPIDAEIDNSSGFLEMGMTGTTVIAPKKRG